MADDHIIEVAFDSYENIKYRDPKIYFPYLKEQIRDKDISSICLIAISKETSEGMNTSLVGGGQKR